MKTINTKKSLDENIRQSEKANTVFLKLLAMQRKPKNPFDEIRSQTYQIPKESKPRVNTND